MFTEDRSRTQLTLRWALKRLTLILPKGVIRWRVCVHRARCMHPRHASIMHGVIPLGMWDACVMTLHMSHVSSCIMHMDHAMHVGTYWGYIDVDTDG